jgi:YebC/PmpR family DNA-binding regulatory protein
MAGHSKWANIKHKKGAADKAKGKIFSRIAKEIMVAAKMGGGDASANPRLRSGLAAAKSANMPNVNIDRAIKKGLGELGDVVFEEIVYEGYGPGGVAVMVECLTDNRNRSASDVRSTFDKNMGNLASSGAVTWMFHRKAHFVITGEKADEELLMDLTLDAGAEDIDVEDDFAEIWGPPEAFEDIVEALSAAGVKTEEAAVIQHPDNTIDITELKVAQQLMRMLDRLEDIDDVQAVHSNQDIAEDVLEQLDV